MCELKFIEEIRKKRQVCPNSLLFDKSLSDSGKLFILMLNAIMTNSDGYEPRQSDISKFLGWGVERTRKAIKDSVKNGYLKVKKNMIYEEGKRAQFSYNKLELNLYRTLSGEDTDRKEYVDLNFETWEDELLTKRSIR